MDILEELNYRVQHRIVSSTRLRGDNWEAMKRAAAEIERIRASPPPEGLREILEHLPCSAEHDSFLEELDAAGYAIVPKQPTPAMLRAVADGPTIAASVWRNMLDAAAAPDRG